jgi:hypothetical protein
VLSVQSAKGYEVRLALLSPTHHAYILSTYAVFWALAATGRVPLPVLVKFVAVCVRVCMLTLSHSGGTNVVDIPNICLPADAYLGMLDSASQLLGDLPSSAIWV